MLSLEAQMQPGVALDRDIKALERQSYWGQGHCTWDLSHAELRRSLREHLGLNDFLETGKEWTEYDLEPYAEKARGLAAQIQAGLNFTIPAGQRPTGKPKMSNVQIIHQLLSQMGVKVSLSLVALSCAGHEGEKLRVYRLDTEHWQAMMTILARRQQKRESLEQTWVERKAGSPSELDSQIQQDDPGQAGAETVVQELIEPGSEALPLQFVPESAPKYSPIPPQFS